MNILKVISIVLFISFFSSGCNSKIISSYQNSIYIGSFKKENVKEKNCEFKSIKGLGFFIGFFNFGIGYIDKSYLKIKRKKVFCKMKIAKVLIFKE